MLVEVKKCAESQDIKGLRYIFVDCLDVDPTFEKYKADYEYCKSISGMFDDHQELSGLIMDESKWTKGYWEQLKLDLMKNFSEKRFGHMVCVAKVVYADKIARLMNERDSFEESKKEVRRPAVKPVSVSETPSPVSVSEAELQKQRLAQKSQKLNEEYKRIEEEQAAQRARIERAEAEKQRRKNQQNMQSKSNRQNASDRQVIHNRQNVHGRKEIGSKKFLGIVLTIIVVVVLIIMAFHGLNPR